MNNQHQNSVIFVNDDSSNLLEFAIYVAAMEIDVYYCNGNYQHFLLDHWHNLIKKVTKHISTNDQEVDLNKILFHLKINKINYVEKIEDFPLENKIQQIKSQIENKEIKLIISNGEEESIDITKLFDNISENCPLLTTSQHQLNWWRENEFLAKRVFLCNVYHPILAKKLIEVDRAYHNSELFDQLVNFFNYCGYKTLISSASSALIVERMYGVYFSEVWKIFAEHAASAPEIDFICREIAGISRGVFELSELLRKQVILLDDKQAHILNRFELSQQSSLLANTSYSKNLYQGVYELNQSKVEVNFLSSSQEIKNISWYGTSGSTIYPLYQRFIEFGKSIKNLTTEDVEELGVSSACFLFDNVKVYLSDGRTASERAVDEDTPNMVLIDFAEDYQQCKYLVLTKADSCSDQALSKAVNAFNLLGIKCLYIDDIAGMVVLRIIAKLLNELGFLLSESLVEAEELDNILSQDCSFHLSLNSWAKRYGYVLIAQVLQNLQEHCGSESYRLSPWLRRKALRAYW